MNVEVTQYLMPDGRKRECTTEISDNVKGLYEEMIQSGYKFEAEMLRTGDISVTISNDEEDIDSRFIENGPGVQNALVEMLKGALWRNVTKGQLNDMPRVGENHGGA